MKFLMVILTSETAVNIPDGKGSRISELQVKLSRLNKNAKKQANVYNCYPTPKKRPMPICPRRHFMDVL